MIKPHGHPNGIFDAKKSASGLTARKLKYSNNQHVHLVQKLSDYD